ncbi:hypothetical protein C7M84_012402 [Penaeus vannamei]|uniref:Cytochrome P450 n=1 Tax=Penaeus vannamei TaxID=6689 RepID=A0A423SYT6_PENVA|nr:hypothetical protein C7M84_012402 [Penaeus vannamei]
MAGAVPSNTGKFLAASFAIRPPHSARPHALGSQDSRWRTWAWVLGFVGRRPYSSSSTQSPPPAPPSPGEFRQEFGDSDRVRPYESIPGPKPLPLVGNKLLFTPLGGYSFERYWESCWKLYDLYGPVVRLAKISGHFDMVLVFRPEDTRKIFECRARKSLTIPVDAPGRKRACPCDLPWTSWSTTGCGILTCTRPRVCNGEEWKRLRVCVHSLLRRELVQSYKAAQAGVAKDLATALDAAKGRHPEGVVPDLLNLLFRYTLEAVGVVSLGTRLGQRRDPGRHGGVALQPALVPGPAHPRLQDPLPGSAHHRPRGGGAASEEEEGTRTGSRGLQGAASLPQFSPRAAGHRSHGRLPARPRGVPRRHRRDGDDAGLLSPLPLEEKEPQETLFEEVKDVEPATHTLQGLPYLRAVVQEAMRLRPSAGGRTRFIHEDGVFSGFHVPAGVSLGRLDFCFSSTSNSFSSLSFLHRLLLLPTQTCVSSPPVIACHDPAVALSDQSPAHGRRVDYAHAQGRRVDHGHGDRIHHAHGRRFDYAHGDRVDHATGIGSTAHGIGSTTPTEETRIHPYTIVPFGHGARMCPGRRVAEQEIYLALIQVVKAFRMECVGSPEGPGEPVGQVLRLNMMPDAPIAIKFTRR